MARYSTFFAYYTLILTLAPLIASAATLVRTTPKPWVYFGHGLRGNRERFNRPCYLGLWPTGISVYAADGPEAVSEEVSRAIDPQRIAEMPLLQKLYWSAYRFGYLNFWALRGAAMGQQGDLERIAQLVTAHNLATEDGMYVGHSKGASTGLNEFYHRKWRAGIFITPFCNGTRAFREFPTAASLPQALIPTVCTVLLPNYDPAGQQPLDLAHSPVNRDTPLLIISVKGDTKVPQYHQFAIYNKLRHAGFSRVYFYEIQQGDHDTLAQHNAAAHEELVETVQAFQRAVDQNDFTALAHLAPDSTAIEARMHHEFAGMTMKDLESP